MNLITSNRRLMLLFLLLAGIVAALIFLARTGDDGKVDSWDTDYAQTTGKREYGLEDARSASNLNVTVYRDEERPLYLGWSGGSPEMEDLTEAVAGATPVAGEPDESFTDLIVFFYDDGDSFSITYSRERALLLFNESLYQPAGDITAVIVAGEERYD